MKFDEFIVDVNEEFDGDDWLDDFNELKSYKGVVFVGSSRGMIDNVDKVEGDLNYWKLCEDDGDVIETKDKLSFEESVYYWLDGE